jgi:rRNA-processing protein FCF1
MQIIFDTNFLIYSIKYRIDFESELVRICDFKFDLCLIDKTIDELKKLKVPEAKIALAVINRFKILDTKDSKLNKVDDILVDLANKGNIIATQDVELKKRIRKITKRIIILRQNKYFRFE